MWRQTLSLRLLPETLVLALVVGVVLAACDDNFRRASELGEEPQIITVRATPPEAGPGQTVTFDALVHWPDSTPTLLWVLCRDGSFGRPGGCGSESLAGLVPPSCEQDPDASLCVLGTDASVEYTVPADLPGPDREAVTLSVLVVAVQSLDALPGCLQDFAQGSPGTGCELALKRLVVSTSPTPNINPELGGLTVNGDSIAPPEPHVIILATDAIDDLKVEVEAQVDATSIDELGAGEPVELVLSWFSSCGELDPDKQFLACTPADGAQPAACQAPPVIWKPKTVGECRIHAVLRDGVGGTGYVSQSVRLQ